MKWNSSKFDIKQFFLFIHLAHFFFHLTLQQLQSNHKILSLFFFYLSILLNIFAIKYRKKLNLGNTNLICYFSCVFLFVLCGYCITDIIDTSKIVGKFHFFYSFTKKKKRKIICCLNHTNGCCIWVKEDFNIIIIATANFLNSILQPVSLCCLSIFLQSVLLHRYRVVVFFYHLHLHSSGFYFNFFSLSWHVQHFLTVMAF